MKLKKRMKHHNLGKSGDENSSHQQTSLYQNPNTNTKKIIIISVLLGALIALAALGIWWYSLNNDKSNQNSRPQIEESQTNAEDDTEPDELSENHSNAELKIDFEYPDGWQVQEGADGLRVESPNFDFDTVDQGQVNGNFRIYMRIQARDNDTKYIGRGIAIGPSQTLNYSDPQPGQHKKTFLTAFGQDRIDNFNFFLVSGSFDLKANDTLGPNFGTEPGAYIIVGGYSSEDLSEDLQMYKVPTENYDNTKQFKEAVEIIKSIKIK